MNTLANSTSTDKSDPDYAEIEVSGSETNAEKSPPASTVIVTAKNPPMMIPASSLTSFVPSANIETVLPSHNPSNTVSLNPSPPQLPQAQNNISASYHNNFFLPRVEIASPCAPQTSKRSNSSLSAKQRRPRRNKHKESFHAFRNDNSISSATKVSLWKQQHLAVPNPKYKSYSSSNSIAAVGADGYGGHRGHHRSFSGQLNYIHGGRFTNHISHTVTSPTFAQPIARSESSILEDPELSPRYKMFKCQQLHQEQYRKPIHIGCKSSKAKGKKAHNTATTSFTQPGSQRQNENQSHPVPQVILHLEGVPLTTSYEDPTYTPVFPLASPRRVSVISCPPTSNGYPCRPYDPFNPYGHTATLAELKYSLDGNATDHGEASSRLTGVPSRQNSQDMHLQRSNGEVRTIQYLFSNAVVCTQTLTHVRTYKHTYIYSYYHTHIIYWTHITHLLFFLSFFFLEEKKGGGQFSLTPILASAKQ